MAKRKITISPDNIIEADSRNNRIFFHETSGKNWLNTRQTCAVESAAKENPERPVQLFLLADRVNDSSPFVKVLSHYLNIQVLLINPSDYFRGTILEDWYRKGEWRTSQFHIEHFSDYIRMLSLYKAGGMYMDLDFVTVKKFDEDLLWNFVPLESKYNLTGSTLHLQHGHRLISAIISELASSYEPEQWTYSGPALVLRVLQRLCNFNGKRPSSHSCSDIRVTPAHYFYPFHYTQWQVYFENATDSRLATVDESFAVHVWNKLSHEGSIDWSSNQLYALLASQHCPHTTAYSSQFVS